MFAIKLTKYDLFNVQYPIYDKYINKFEKISPKYRNNKKIEAILNIVITELKTFKKDAVYYTLLAKSPNKFAENIYNDFKAKQKDEKNKIQEEQFMNMLYKTYLK